MIRIAITGPESTGKSALAQALAEHFGTAWVPEYAREYLGKLDRPYHYDDLLAIADGQRRAEDSLDDGTEGFLFCDTDALVLYVWSTFRFGKCHPELNDWLEEGSYALHLLCDVDLPWEYDPLREHPEQRNELFSLYLRELEARRLPYRVVSGRGEERTANAIRILSALFPGIKPNMA